jgi:hypothetical protein
MDGECLLALADVGIAAEAFTRFAREHPSDPRAPKRLARAVELQRELGDPARTLAIAREFRQAFPTHPHSPGVAEQVFLLGQYHQQRDEADREADLYELYLKEWSKAGGVDREVVAHVRLAALLLERSCPVTGVRGACVEPRQVPFKCPEAGVPADIKAKQPTNLTNEVVVRHRRDVALVRKAEEHLAAARRLADKAKAEGRRQDRTMGRARHNDLADAIAESVLLAAHDARDEFFQLRAPPSGLYFDVPTQFDSPAVAERKRWALEESNRRYVEWLRAKIRLAKFLKNAAHKATLELGPTSAVHAAGLLAEVQTGLATLTEDREHHRACRTDEFICGGSGDWLLEENADIAITTCATLADSIPMDDEWSRYCQPRGGVSRRPRPGRIVQAPPPRQQNELLPGLRLTEWTDTGKKPGQNPGSEIRSDRFAPHPFPGHRRVAAQGTLRMNDGHEFASLFGRQPPFDNTILDRLAAQAGPFRLPNRASMVRLTILGVPRECYHPLPSTLIVETAGKHIVSLDSPELGTNISCLEKAAKALVLPEVYFNEEQARWRIGL